jgi:hypothetical protein
VFPRIPRSTEYRMSQTVGADRMRAWQVSLGSGALVVGERRTEREEPVVGSRSEHSENGIAHLGRELADGFGLAERPRDHLGREEPVGIPASDQGCHEGAGLLVGDGTAVQPDQGDSSIRHLQHTPEVKP